MSRKVTFNMTDMVDASYAILEPGIDLPPTADVSQLAQDLGVKIPKVTPLNLNRVRSRFLLDLLGRLSGQHVAAVMELHQNFLDNKGWVPYGVRIRVHNTLADCAAFHAADWDSAGAAHASLVRFDPGPGQDAEEAKQRGALLNAIELEMPGNCL